MRRQVIYVRRYRSRPMRFFLNAARIFFWALFIGIVIESLVHTTATFHPIMSRKTNVHTDSPSR